MKIWFDKDEVNLETGSTIDDFLKQFRIDTSGSALVLNEVICPKGDWDKTILNEEDRISVFKVIAGG
ncbi:sulfur carrier protein ThiS [Vibrio sp. HN007]|uniref:sulfur carrier protein ThiS n=1 Tax=Vibrio iocasae TaxID=3098914 RepID=UPI0035D51DC9